MLSHSVMSKTLCNVMVCSPPDSSVHGISQARILELSSHFLLQGIFPTQGSSPLVYNKNQVISSRSGALIVKITAHVFTIRQALDLGSVLNTTTVECRL